MRLLILLSLFACKVESREELKSRNENALWVAQEPQTGLCFVLFRPYGAAAMSGPVPCPQAEVVAK